MLSISRIILVALLGSPLAAASALATLNVSAGASVVHLRQDCGSMSDCGDDMAELLTWLWTTRNPTAGDRVTVEIGPGTFAPISCNNDGYVTFRGAGRENTVIGGAASTRGVEVVACTDLNFQDLAVKAYDTGVWWESHSTGTLTNLDILVGGSSTEAVGWWDPADPACFSNRPKVFWWNVRVEVEATAEAGGSDHVNMTIYSQCAEHWIYGSEFNTFGSSGSPADAGPLLGIYLLGGDVRLFGSVVRAQVGAATGTVWHDLPVFPGFPTVPGFAGVFAGPNSEFHMHGGIVNVDASASTELVNVFGIDANRFFPSAGAVMAHTPGTAFVVKPGTGGTATRVRQNLAMVQSPFQWPASSSAPAITSVSGYDTFVETDCAANGNCSAAGTETHLMIYNSSCSTGGPWFNLATQKCRGVTVP